MALAVVAPPDFCYKKFARHVNDAYTSSARHSTSSLSSHFYSILQWIVLYSGLHTFSYHLNISTFCHVTQEYQKMTHVGHLKVTKVVENDLCEVCGVSD